MRRWILALLLALQASIGKGGNGFQLKKMCSAGCCDTPLDSRFYQRKGALLEAISCGVDKSKKGSFDAPIASMLEHINRHAAYVTTSSCSGRIALFLESSQGIRSKGGDWLLCEHATVTSEDVKRALGDASDRKNGLVYFKHEPFIMHVQCRSLEDACKFLEVAKKAGYRESGISPGKKHTMVAVRTSSLKMDIPILKNGTLMVSSEYIDEIVQLANEKFVKNRMRTDEYYALLKRELLCGVDDDASNDSSVVETAQPKTSVDDTARNGLWAIVCSGADCEEFRQILLKHNWLDRSRRNVKLESGKISVPLTYEGKVALDKGVDAQLSDALKATQIELRLQDQGAASGKGSTMSPHARLRQVLSELLRPVVDDAAAAPALASIPRHWEEYGDLILLPEGSFSSEPWDRIPQATLWEAVASGLGVPRIAMKAEVDEGPMRQSHVKVLHPAGGDGWVRVAQNGLQYTWDVTRVMFSRGNVNERRRMGLVGRPGETAVDLFAGIGYFTVPLLAHGQAGRVYACEWNPDSVAALRRNLRLNGVEDRCEVLEGDNQRSGESGGIKGVADRVLLGLLPSSECAWALGVACLRDVGGWLHVHANIGETEEAAWTSRLQAELERLAAAGGRGGWRCEVRHVERVKTYAPRVWHVVADVECRPPAARA